MGMQGLQAEREVSWTSRRRRRRGYASLSVLVAAATALAACSGGGSGGSGSGASATGGTAAQQTAELVTPAGKEGMDTLVWNLPDGEPTTLDYIQAGDYSPDTVISNMCDTLVRQNPDYSIKPNLASSWEYSADHLTLTYKLRQDVKFWDGTPLTAKDAAYSMKRNMSTTNGAINGGFYANVSSIEAQGDDTVVVRFTKPDELFNKEMATVAGMVSQESYTKAKGEKFGTAAGGVMCSGPFEFVSWKPGSQIELKANPDYWDAEYKPRVKNVVIKFITDTSSMISALKSGELDGAYHVPYIAYPALAQGGGQTSLFAGRSLELALLLPIGEGPGADPKIRRALSLVIDRAAIAKALYQGIGAEPNYTLLSPSLWDPTATDVYRQALTALNIPAKPDAAAAKKALEGSANASKPIALAVMAGDQHTLQLATLIQAEAQSIGLDVKIQQLQPLQFSNAFYIPSARKGLDFIFTEGWADVADPLDYLTLTLLPDGALNMANYNNPQVTDLLDKARQTFDDTERAKLITQAQAIYEGEQAVVPIEQVKSLLYMNGKITGGIPSFSYVFLPNLARIGLK